MNSLARWENYSPFYVGLEGIFRDLDRLQDSGSNFPPYNIVREDDNNHIIEIALAGYNQDQLEVSVEKNILTVKGTKLVENKTYTYRGLAQRSFNRAWTLGDDVKINEVTFVNGMLKIHLIREVPEEVPEEAEKLVFPINVHIQRLESALKETVDVN